MGDLGERGLNPLEIGGDSLGLQRVGLGLVGGEQYPLAPAERELAGLVGPLDNDLRGIRWRVGQLGEQGNLLAGDGRTPSQDRELGLGLGLQLRVRVGDDDQRERRRFADDGLAAALGFSIGGVAQRDLTGLGGGESDGVACAEFVVPFDAEFSGGRRVETFDVGAEPYRLADDGDGAALDRELEVGLADFREQRVELRQPILAEHFTFGRQTFDAAGRRIIEDMFYFKFELGNLQQQGPVFHRIDRAVEREPEMIDHLGLARAVGGEAGLGQFHVVVRYAGEPRRAAIEFAGEQIFQRRTGDRHPVDAPLRGPERLHLLLDALHLAIGLEVVGEDKLGVEVDGLGPRLPRGDLGLGPGDNALARHAGEVADAQFKLELLQVVLHLREGGTGGGFEQGEQPLPQADLDGVFDLLQTLVAGRCIFVLRGRPRADVLQEQGQLGDLGGIREILAQRLHLAAVAGEIPPLAIAKGGCGIGLAAEFPRLPRDEGGPVAERRIARNQVAEVAAVDEEFRERLGAHLRVVGVGERERLVLPVADLERELGHPPAGVEGRALLHQRDLLGKVLVLAERIESLQVLARLVEGADRGQVIKADRHAGGGRVALLVGVEQAFAQREGGEVAGGLELGQRPRGLHQPVGMGAAGLVGIEELDRVVGKIHRRHQLRSLQGLVPLVVEGRDFVVERGGVGIFLARAGDKLVDPLDLPLAFVPQVVAEQAVGVELHDPVDDRGGELVGILQQPAHLAGALGEFLGRELGVRDVLGEFHRLLEHGGRIDVAGAQRGALLLQVAPELVEGLPPFRLRHDRGHLVEAGGNGPAGIVEHRDLGPRLEPQDDGAVVVRAQGFPEFRLGKLADDVVDLRAAELLFFGRDHRLGQTAHGRIGLRHRRAEGGERLVVQRERALEVLHHLGELLGVGEGAVGDVMDLVPVHLQREHGLALDPDFGQLYRAVLARRRLPEEHLAGFNPEFGPAVLQHDAVVGVELEDLHLGAGPDEFHLRVRLAPVIDEHVVGGVAVGREQGIGAHHVEPGVGDELALEQLDQVAVDLHVRGRGGKVDVAGEIQVRQPHLDPRADVDLANDVGGLVGIGLGVFADRLEPQLVHQLRPAHHQGPLQRQELRFPRGPAAGEVLLEALQGETIQRRAVLGGGELAEKGGAPLGQLAGGLGGEDGFGFFRRAVLPAEGGEQRLQPAGVLAQQSADLGVGGDWSGGLVLGPAGAGQQQGEQQGQPTWETIHGEWGGSRG